MTLADLSEIVVLCLSAFAAGYFVGFKVQMTLQFFKQST
jgi:hypothetical protein